MQCGIIDDSENTDLDTALEEIMSKTLEELEHDYYLRCGFRTRALHSGEHFQQPQHQSHTNAIYQSSTFVFENAKHGAELFGGQRDGYIYTRLGNPTVVALEAKINSLEGREVKLRNPELTVSTLAFSSGMAAITAATMAVLSKGDKIITDNVLYGCTETLFSDLFPRYGIQTVSIDMSDSEVLERTLKTHGDARILYFETPTNPTMKVIDIEKSCSMARAAIPGIKIMIDNTFATPYLQQPLLLGADVSINSTTKYICGHGTVVGGVATSIDDSITGKMYYHIKNFGSIPGPFDAWLVNQGVKTLPIRMESHCDNAEAMAEFLASHPKILRVFYPGLADSPYREVALKQMKRFGGMISFELKGGYEAGVKLMDNIQIFTLAVSLGTLDSLIQHPASMTHKCVSEEVRLKGGITNGLVRTSIGIEDIDDLIMAMDEGLSGV